MESFLLNGRSISWEQLETAVPNTAHEADVLQFLTDWKNGSDSFEITTSGSTGPPKTIPADRQLMIQSARRTIRYLGLTHRDHALVCMNTKYIAGKMMLVRAIMANMKLTIMDPESDPFDKAGHGATFTALVPLQLQRLVTDHIPFLQHYRAILAGGAPLSAALRERCANLTTPVFETYGMTETLTHIALKRISGPAPETFFRVLPGVEIRKDHHECLQIRADVTGNKWIDTNDIVDMRGNDGFIWLGRRDFVINSGGIKIHPEQAEAKIADYFREKGWLQRFIVIPTDDPNLGETVSLVIEGRLPAAEQELLNELRYTITTYERPRRVLLMDQFPETGSGKIDRDQVIRHFNPS